MKTSYKKYKNVANKIFDAKPRFGNPRMVISRKFIEYVRSCNENNIGDVYKAFSENAMFRSFYSKKKQDIFICYMSLLGNMNGELYWLIESLKNNSSYINNFIEEVNEYERNYALSNYSFCMQKLKDISNHYGVTLWSICEETKCTYNLFSFEDAKKHITCLKKFTHDPVILNIIDYLTVKSESGIADNYIAVVKNVLRDIRNAGYEWAASFLSLYLLPRESDQTRDPLHIPVFIPSLPLPDQYLLFRSAIIDLVIAGNHDQFEKVTKALNSLKDIISDKTLSNIALYISGEHHGNYDKNLIPVLKTYSSGNYAECVRQIESVIKDDPLNTAYLEIYAKCIVRMKVPVAINEGSNISKVSSLLASIVSINKDCSTDILNLRSLLVKSYPQGWTLPLLSQLYNIFPDYEHEARKISNKRALLSSLPTTPKQFGIDKTNDIAETYLESAKILQEPDQECFHNERKIKTELYKMLSMDPLCPFDEFNHYFKAADKLDTDFKYEFERIKVLYYIKTMQLEIATKIVVDSYLENSEFFRCFPIRKLILAIEKKGKYSYPHLIDIPIIYHIYSQRISKDRDDDRNEAYEDFINSIGDYRPSFAFSKKTSLDRKEYFFLKNICVPSIMDVSPEYDNYDEVRAERINVIDLVLALDEKDKEDLLQEKFKIIDDIIVEKSKAGIELCKINVDVDMIIEECWGEYLSLYETYRSREPETIEISSDPYVIVGDNPESQLAMPRGDKDSILLRVIHKMYSDFVTSHKYGLDKALSVNIRHGSFLNLMRSVPEKYSLLTEVDENGEYADNIHWIGKYSYYDYNIAIRVSNILKDFSRDFDEILLKANNWLKTTNSTDDSDHVFNFGITPDEFDSIRSMIEDSCNCKDFFNKLLAFYWDKTNLGLLEARRRINEDLRSHINHAIEVVLDNVGKLKESDVDVSDITSKIYAIKNDFNQVLPTISDWLERRESVYYGSLELLTLIEVSIQSFSALKGEMKIEFVRSFDPNDFIGASLDSEREARAIVMVLVTALDNAVKYHYGSPSPAVIIDLEKSESSLYIRVKNRFNPDKFQGRLEEFFANTNERLRNLDRSNLLTTEGGTGLYKINAILQQSSAQYSTQVFYENNNLFVVEIRKIDNAHTTC